MFQVKTWSVQGQTLKQYTHTNDHFSVSFLNRGATIHSIHTPDQKGKLENIVLTYADIDRYLDNSKLLGSSVGPYAGRLSPACIPFKDALFLLEDNFMENINLHSGSANLAHVLWDVESMTEDSITFVYTLKDSSFYPGHINFKTRYHVDKNTLNVDYETSSQEDNFISMTNHTYFNLSGDLKRTIEDHELYLPSQQMGQLNSQFISEKLIDVDRTIFDFNVFSPLRHTLKSLKKTAQKGLDHPFILKEPTVVLQDPISKRRLTVTTDQEAVVVYSNNFVEEVKFVPDVWDRAYLGLCLETQAFPNDVHFRAKPQSFIAANTIKKQRTHYIFDLMPN